jgi:hypothetical protein
MSQCTGYHSTIELYVLNDLNELLASDQKLVFITIKYYFVYLFFFFKEASNSLRNYLRGLTLI